jgi:integrase
MNTSNESAEYHVWQLDKQAPDIRAQQPVIVRHPDMEIDRSTFRFIRDRYILHGTRESARTWRSCADALATWLNWCLANDISVELADTLELIEYRDAYLNSISPQGGYYKASTVATRIGYIQEFYDYLSDMGFYHEDITRSSEPKHNFLSNDQDFYAHARKTRRHDDARSSGLKLKPKQKGNEPVHPLGPSDLSAILKWADRSSAPQRNRALLNFGWVCGLRREEVIALRAPQFQAVTTDPDAPAVLHPIRVTGKGGVTRNVPVPAWLIDEINSYIEGERTAAIKKGRIRKPSPQLLLGSVRSSKKAGQPISVSAIEHVMKTGCTQAGIIELVERPHRETEELKQISRPKHSFHDLRHTFAVVTYHLERRNGNPEPWKKIQAALGHKRLSTTIDLYLKHVENFDFFADKSSDYRSLL